MSESLRHMVTGVSLLATYTDEYRRYGRLNMKPDYPLMVGTLKAVKFSYEQIPRRDIRTKLNSLGEGRAAG